MSEHNRKRVRVKSCYELIDCVAVICEHEDTTWLDSTMLYNFAAELLQLPPSSYRDLRRAEDSLQQLGGDQAQLQARRQRRQV